MMGIPRAQPSPRITMRFEASADSSPAPNPGRDDAQAASLGNREPLSTPDEIDRARLLATARAHLAALKASPVASPGYAGEAVFQRYRRLMHAAIAAGGLEPRLAAPSDGVPARELERAVRLARAAASTAAAAHRSIATRALELAQATAHEFADQVDATARAAEASATRAARAEAGARGAANAATKAAARAQRMVTR